jgi:Fe2+ or Zn2+ uptake regulation protein
MRVVLALGADDLTTKQLRKRLPDVAQASLYRAIARLVDAGIIAVVERRQRGGAMERVYRVVHAPGSDHAIATTHGFVAAADTLARALSVDAAQWAASTSWQPHRAHLRREVLHLSTAQLAEFAARVEQAFDEGAASETPGSTTAVMVTLAAIPATSDAAKVHGEDQPSDR